MRIDRDATEFNPDNPCDAQVILLEYLRVFEEKLQHSDSLPPLPYPRETLEKALRTAARALRATGHMSNDVCAYLEMAYVALGRSDSNAPRSAEQLREEFRHVWNDSRRG